MTNKEKVLKFLESFSQFDKIYGWVGYSLNFETRVRDLVQLIKDKHSEVGKMERIGLNFEKDSTKFEINFHGNKTSFFITDKEKERTMKH